MLTESESRAVELPVERSVRGPFVGRAVERAPAVDVAEALTRVLAAITS